MEHELIEIGTADPAATAFDRLRREVTTLRLAVEQLADAPTKLEMPDYTETLGQMASGIAEAANGLKALRSSPALALTPDELARQIAHAGAEARKAEQATLHQASAALGGAAGDLRGWVDTARLASVQNLRLLQAGGAAFVGGILLWSMLPGIVARAVPESWHWPERMATRTMRMDLSHAGARLLHIGAPQRVAMLSAIEHATTENQRSFLACIEDGAKAAKSKRCSISVDIEPYRQDSSERSVS